MEENPIQSDTLFPHETGRHRSSRERQRKGPMWGCLRLMMTLILGTLALVVLLVIVAPWVLNSTVTTNYIVTRI